MSVNKKVAILVASCGVAGLGMTGFALNQVSADTPATSSSQTSSTIGAASDGVITLKDGYRPIVQSFTPSVNQDLLKTLDSKLYTVELKRQYNASSLPQGKTLTIHVSQPQGSNGAIDAGLTFTVSSVDQFNSVMKDLMNAGYQPGIYQHQDNNGKVEYTGLLLHSPSVMVAVKDQDGKVLGYQAIYNTVTNKSDSVNMLSQLSKTNSLVKIPFKNIYNSSVITYQGTDGKTYQAPYVSSDMKDGVEFGLKNDSTSDATLTSDMSKSPFEQLYLRNYEVTVQKPQALSSSAASQSASTASSVLSSAASAVNASSASSASSKDGKDVVITAADHDLSSSQSGSSQASDHAASDSSVAKSDAKDQASDSSIVASSSAKDSAVKSSKSSVAKGSDVIDLGGSADKDSSSTKDAITLGKAVKNDNKNDGQDGNADNGNQTDGDGASQNQNDQKNNDAKDSSSSSSSSSSNDSQSSDSDSNVSDSSSSDSSSSNSSSASSSMPQTGEMIAEHPFASILTVLGLLTAGGSGLWFINRKANKK